MPVEHSAQQAMHPVPIGLEFSIGGGHQTISLPPHWVQHTEPRMGAESAMQHPVMLSPAAQHEEELGPPSPTTLHGLAPDRAAALFRAYDLMGRGWLSRTQMIAALSELSVVHGLGEKGLNHVLGQDPATSREARYSLQDFLSMYDRIGLYQAKSARDERIKAMSAISQPPPGAATSPALQVVFSAYCRYAAGTSRMLMAQAEQETQGEQRMNAQQLMRLCQDLELLSSGGLDAPPAPLNFSTVDVVFAKCKPPGGSRRLNYTQWLRALAALSDAAGRDLFAIITAHALRMQPHLAGPQQSGQEGVVPTKAGGARSLPPSRERVGTSHASGLPRLRISAEQGNGMRASAAGALQVLSPGGRTSRGAATAAGVPGRLVVLERALMEEDARAAGQAAALNTEGPNSDSPRDVKPATVRPGSQLALRNTARAQPTEAWPAEQPGANNHSAGGAPEQLPPVQNGGGSPAGSRNVTPPRPRTTGSPLRGTRLARVSLVDTAGVATEVWKFHPARPEAWDEAPPWIAPLLLRLQHLEAREQERSAEDELLRADVIFRTQRWEQAERLVVSKTSTLETRLLALERRSGDSDALLGGLKRQVDGLQGMADEVAEVRKQMAEVKQEVAQGGQWREALEVQRERVEAEMLRLREEVGNSSGGWQAAVAMAKQATADQLQAVSEEVARVSGQPAGLDASAVGQLIETQVTAMAEHLASELGLAAAQQAAAAMQPLHTALGELQEHVGAALPRVEEHTSMLAAQHEATEALKAEMEQMKAHVTEAAAVAEKAASTSANSPAADAAPTTAPDAGALVAALEAKIGAHVVEVSTQLAELAVKQEAVEQLPSQLGELAARQDAVEKELAKVAAAASAAAAAASAKDAPEERIAAPVAAAPAPEVTSAMLVELEAKLTVQLEQLDSKVTDLSAASEQGAAKDDSQLQDRIQELAAQVEAAAATATAAEAAATNLAAEAAAATQAAAEASAAAAKAAAEAAEAKAAATAQAAQAPSETASAAPPATVDLSGVRAQCAAAEQHLTDLSSKVQSLEESLAATAAGLASVQDNPPAVAQVSNPADDARWTDLVSRIEETEGQVKRLAEPRPTSAAVPPSSKSFAALKEEVAELDVMRGQLKVVQSQVGQLAGQLVDVQGAVGRADASATTANSQAAAAQAAAAEAIRMASEAVPAAPAGVSQAELDARLAALSQEMTERLSAGASAAQAQAGQAAATASQAAAAVSQLELTVKALETASQTATAGSGGAGDQEQLKLLQAAVVQAGTKLAELETGMQALASAALDSARRAQSAAPTDTPPADVTTALAARLAAVEASVATLNTKQAEAANHVPRSVTMAVTEDGGPDSADMHSRGASRDGGAHASRRDHDALRIKVTQMGTTLQDLQHKISNLQSGGGAGGVGHQPPPSPGPGGAATVGALQVAQMQVVQQLAMMQGTLQQLGSKVSNLETKAAVGTGAGTAAEVMQQATASQMSLLQGAIVQLSGEVNSIKLAVPQLVSSIKGATGGTDAAALTAAVASGQYGPVLGAIAEELQRCSVRAGNIESDVRISLTSLAKASDVSQLELVLGARTERLEEAVEDLRNALRNVTESHGGIGANAQGFNRIGTAANRMTSAVGGMPAPSAGDVTPAGGGAHRFATWDALKHAEAMLIKTQQQAKEEITKLVNSMGDLNSKISGSEDKLIQRLDVKEKILMRMAKEVDEVKTTVEGLVAKVNAPPPGPANQAGRAAAVASRTKSHRYNMFDD